MFHCFCLAILSSKLLSCIAETALKQLHCFFVDLVCGIFLNNLSLLLGKNYWPRLSHVINSSTKFFRLLCGISRFVNCAYSQTVIKYYKQLSKHTSFCLIELCTATSTLLGGQLSHNSFQSWLLYYEHRTKPLFHFSAYAGFFENIGEQAVLWFAKFHEPAVESPLAYMIRTFC